jgi:hypothetical protein
MKIAGLTRKGYTARRGEKYPEKGREIKYGRMEVWKYGSRTKSLSKLTLPYFHTSILPYSHPGEICNTEMKNFSISSCTDFTSCDLIGDPIT